VRRKPREFGESFDGVRPPTVRVPASDLDAALAGWTATFRVHWLRDRTHPRRRSCDQRRADSRLRWARALPPSPAVAPSSGSGCMCRRQRRVPALLVMNVGAGAGLPVWASLGGGRPPQAQSQARFFRAFRPLRSLPAARMMFSASTKWWAVGGVVRRWALLAYGVTYTTSNNRAGPGRPDHRSRNILRHRCQTLCRSESGIATPKHVNRDSILGR